MTFCFIAKLQLLRQPDAQPYEIVRLPEYPLRHLTHCLSFLCVLTKILCVKYAVTPLNGNAGACAHTHRRHSPYRLIKSNRMCSDGRR